jgi:hypothetical protein
MNLTLPYVGLITPMTVKGLLFYAFEIGFIIFCCSNAEPGLTWHIADARATQLGLPGLFTVSL